MYQTHKTFISPSKKMSDLIEENSRLLLLLEHFEIDFAVGDRSISKICQEHQLSEVLFTAIANLYNGFYPDKKVNLQKEDIPLIIRFLMNSHHYYTQDKYPEITGYIEKLLHNTKDSRVKLIEDFFKSYFDEVLEHLDYEDNTAFPYFLSLVKNSQNKGGVVENFSANEYSNHHTDIETKLADLKNLLIKHIPLKNELMLRRKLFFALQELEYDLRIHSQIEESMLLPLANKIEKEWKSTK